MSASIFKRRLSHAVNIEYGTMFGAPELELFLDYSRIFDVSIRSSSDGRPTTLYQQEVAVGKRQSVHTTPLRGFILFSKADPVVRNLLSQVPELSSEQRDHWEESITSYIRKAADGVWIGKLRVAVHVSLVTEIVCHNKKRKRI